MAVKTITLTNIMANDGKGWFNASRSNCTWSLSSDTPGDGAASSVKVTPSAAGECTLTSSAHDLVASHKYYISFQVKLAAATSGSCDWYWPIAEPVAARLDFNVAANTWTRLSATFERTTFTDGSQKCRWDYNNTDGANTAIYLTSVMLFDLTAAFGEGNEPNKEWMDENVASFGDSVTVQYTENIIWTPPEGWEEKSGAHVSFKSPCDCSSAGNLRIGSNVYSIVDACANVLTGKGGAFVSGAVLDLVLDCENLKAYLQNSAASSIGVSKIQYGTVNVSFDAKGTSASVTFPKPFSTKPIVICQQVFDSINCCIKTENVSTTGFTIGIPAVDSTGSRDVMWIAVGN